MMLDATYCAAAAFCGQRVGNCGTTTLTIFPWIDILLVLSTLLSAIGIQLGLHLVRQVSDIPMFSSPAPYIAAFFRGWYEYPFLRQIRESTISEAGKSILHAFCWTKS